MKMLHVDNMDYRENAIVIYDGKIYADFNHQYAFEMALNDNGKSLDFNVEDDILRAEKITDKAIKDGIITTWHWFLKGEQNYMICNFKNDFDKLKNDKIISEYSKKHNMIVGYLDSEMNIIIN